MSERVDFFLLEDGQPVQAKVAHAVVPLSQQAVGPARPQPAAAKQGAATRAVGRR